MSIKPRFTPYDPTGDCTPRDGASNCQHYADSDSEAGRLYLYNIDDSYYCQVFCNRDELQRFVDYLWAVADKAWLPVDHKKLFFDALVEYIDRRIEQKLNERHENNEDVVRAARVHANAAKNDLKTSFNDLCNTLFMG